MVNVPIILFFSSLAVLCLVIIAIFLFADSKLRRQGNIVVGYVVNWQKTRLPGFGRVMISYSIRGRHYMCMTSLIPNWKKHEYKPTSMRRYVIHKYPKTGRFDTMYVATPIGRRDGV